MVIRVAVSLVQIDIAGQIVAYQPADHQTGFIEASLQIANLFTGVTVVPAVATDQLPDFPLLPFQYMRFLVCESPGPDAAVDTCLLMLHTLDDMLGYTILFMSVAGECRSCDAETERGGEKGLFEGDHRLSPV